jgi:phenylacetate-coenzyme A ligase PaaK-like adenylate-forming protein
VVQTYRPTALFGFPSTGSSLADALGDAYRFRAAVLASETTLPAQIRAVERIADKVIVTYGLAEGATFALRCPSCGAYGETTSHALATLRARQDGLFDVVGTAFWALGTLFISYQTGDVTTGTVKPCADCPPGGLRLANVQGRSQDALVDRHGSRHTLGCVVSSRSVIDRMSEVLLYDCLQREAGHVLLRYVSRHGRQIDEQAVAQALRHVAPELIFELQYEPGLLAMRDNLPLGKKWKLVKLLD